MRAPMSMPIQGPNKYPPAAIGRPVRVISVTVESGMRKRDKTTPKAISNALVVRTDTLVFEEFMETRSFQTFVGPFSGAKS